MLLLQPGQPGSLVPVYQCLHAFDVLGQRGLFEQYYAENRRVCPARARARALLTCRPVVGAARER